MHLSRVRLTRAFEVSHEPSSEKCETEACCSLSYTHHWRYSFSSRCEGQSQAPVAGKGKKSLSENRLDIHRLDHEDLDGISWHLHRRHSLWGCRCALSVTKSAMRIGLGNEAHREVTSQPLRGNLKFVGSIAVSLTQYDELD